MLLGFTERHEGKHAQATGQGENTSVDFYQ